MAVRGRAAPELSVAVTTLAPMTATATPAPDRLPGGRPSGRVAVSLDAAAHLALPPTHPPRSRSRARSPRRGRCPTPRSRSAGPTPRSTAPGSARSSPPRPAPAGTWSPADVRRPGGRHGGGGRRRGAADLGRRAAERARGPAAATHRRGGAELLVRLPGGGYVPVIVVRHRVSDPGSGALTAPLPDGRPARGGRRSGAQAPLPAARPPAARAPAPHAGGRRLGPGSRRPVPAARRGDRDGRRRRRLARPARRALAGRAQHAGGVRRPVRRPPRRRHGRRDRRPGARPAVADHGVPALPVVAHLRGRARARAATSAWSCAATRRRRCGPRASPPSRGWRRWTRPPSRPSRSAARRSPTSWRSPAPGSAGWPWCGGCRSCRCRGRTSRWTSTWRASGSPGPTCGVPCSRTRAARVPGDEPEGYRAFATWEPVPTPDEARSFAAFWAWLTGVRERAAATGRSFAAYCYNEQAENRWLLASARRFAGHAGDPAVRRRSRRSSPIPAGWTSSPWSASGSCARTARGSSGSPRPPGSGGATPRPAGRTRCAGTATRSGWTAPRRDPQQRRRLLEYNADDVAATRALREWMTSPAVLEVPLAREL